MMIFIIFSILISFCSSHWIMVWVALELNSISFCSFMSYNFKSEKFYSHLVFLYYSIQLFSSIFILFISFSGNSQLTFTMILMLIFMKLGAWPFQTWYMKMIFFIPMDSKSFLTIVSLQKLIPSFMVLHFIFDFNLLLLITLISLNMLFSSFLLQSNLSTKMIIGTSSMNNNSWMVMSIVGSVDVFIVFIIFYFYTIFLSIKMMITVSKKNILEGNLKHMVIMLCNLGGIPPLSMFWMKLMILSLMVMTSFPKEIILLMVLVACLFLYNYTWMVLNSVMLMSKKGQMLLFKEYSYYTKLIIIISMLSILTQLF